MQVRVATYTMKGPGTSHHVERVDNNHYELVFDDGRKLTIPFQRGEPDVVGVNGISLEALLLLGIDRLKQCQAGSYPCAENDRAIAGMDAAMAALVERSARIVREEAAAKAEASAPSPA